MKKVIILFLMVFALMFSLAEAKRFKGSKGQTIAYIVTGTVSPDCTGNYVLNGIYNGKNYYKRTPDNAYYIWWYLTNWNITENLTVPEYIWTRSDPNILGEYQPYGLSTGIATVSLP